jgi:hypothetical protein
MMSFQTLLLPLINKLNDYLGPIIDKFSGALTGEGGVGEVLMGVSEKLGETLGGFAKTMADKIFGKDFFSTMKTFAQKIGSFVGVVSDFIKENPKLTAALVGVLALGGPIMSLVGGISKFIGGIGSLIRGIGSMFGKGGAGAGAGGSMFGKGGKMGGKMGGMGLGLGLGAAALGANIWRSQLDDKDSSGGKTLGMLGKGAEWGAYGSLLGPYGAAIAGGAGLIKGGYDEFFTRGNGSSSGGVSVPGYATGTGNITKPGIGIVGENGPELTQLSRGTKIHPSDSEFSMSVNPIEVKGSISLEANGQTIDNDILKDPLVMREITKMVQEGIRSAIGGGKLNPST